MIVDSSAIMAILFDEPEAPRIANAIAAANQVRLPATCFVEIAITLLARNREEGLRSFDLFVARAQLEITPFTESQSRTAREAFRRFGKGRHPAQLNFGDCMTYALTIETGEELLFKGTDFSLTDVARAAY